MGLSPGPFLCLYSPCDFETMTHNNLFAALRAAFPADLTATAVETDEGLRYSWQDLDRATAMMANLLKSLDLPEGSYRLERKA